jgi:ligand-binding SRPBCC domain-containing protein
MSVYAETETNNKGKRTKHVVFVDGLAIYQGWHIERVECSGRDTMYKCSNTSLNASFETANWQHVKRNINFFTKQLSLF